MPSGLINTYPVRITVMKTGGTPEVKETLKGMVNPATPQYTLPYIFPYPGTYSVFCVIDPDNIWEETNESDNSKMIEVYVEGDPSSGEVDNVIQNMNQAQAIQSLAKAILNEKISQGYTDLPCEDIYNNGSNLYSMAVSQYSIGNYTYANALANQAIASFEDTIECTESN